MNVRKADIADVDTIGKIHAESWKVAYKGIVPQNYLDELDGVFWVEPLRNWMKTGVLDVYILEGEDGSPIGCVSFGDGRDETHRGSGEIVAIYLLPAYFDKGLGRCLMDTALKQLKIRGKKDVYLWVLEENNRGRRFYEKYGFTNNGDQCICVISEKQLTECRYVYRIV